MDGYSVADKKVFDISSSGVSGEVESGASIFMYLFEPTITQESNTARRSRPLTRYVALAFDPVILLVSAADTGSAETAVHSTK